ncbi:MAG: hypothetical protein WAV78_26805, partial [Xanthobacteraceae bacterium]
NQGSGLRVVFDAKYLLFPELCHARIQEVQRSEINAPAAHKNGDLTDRSSALYTRSDPSQYLAQISLPR